MKNVGKCLWIIVLVILGAAGWSKYGRLTKQRREAEDAELEQREADFQSEGNPVAPSSHS